MSNEQKLREAFELGWKMAANWSLSDHLFADMESPAYLTERDGLLQALATTAPEPTGMPELHPVAHIELGDDSHDVVTIEAAKAYGEQCWKAGYKHGAWAGEHAAAPSRNSLRVVDSHMEDLISAAIDGHAGTRDAMRWLIRQLAYVVEPVDERAAFEREMMRRKSWTVYDFQPHPRRGEYPHPDYIASYANTAWAGWQARAAMAQVSDINVVESFTNDTKDAARYRWLRDDTDSDWAICEWSHDPGDEGYYRDARAPHIVDAAIDAAMAKGVKG